MNNSEEYRGLLRVLSSIATSLELQDQRAGRQVKLCLALGIAVICSIAVLGLTIVLLVDIRSLL